MGFMCYANSKGTDYPWNLMCILILAFVLHCLNRIIPLASVLEISVLKLVSLAGQANFCHTRS